MTQNYPQAKQFMASTHEVENQPKPLENYNLYLADKALQKALIREGADWADSDLTAFGELAGKKENIELGFQANKYQPELRTHDRYGHRIDQVDFHPSYHQLMTTAIEHGLHASPWSDPTPGAHVARAAKYYLHTQVEASHGCPITMTFASIPALRHQPDLLKEWGPKITARHYDSRNIPHTEKSAVTIGMAMTEKQGGSDVRRNSTRAYPVSKEGAGQAYELIGHKWFVSAPMCDAFLVLAQTNSGLSCFLVPRWRPDGSKNPIQIQQLKQKMGNAANASSETELRGALGWMVGEEGRGVRTIIEMAYPFVLKQRKVNLNKKAAIVCPDGEQHELGARMVSDYLRIMGYETYFVGRDTPRLEFLDMIKVLDLDVVAISVTNYYNLSKALQTVVDVKEHFPEVTFVAGGRGLDVNSEVLIKHDVLITHDLNDLKRYLGGNA